MALNLLQSYADDNSPCSKNRFDATSKEVTQRYNFWGALENFFVEG